MDVDKELHLWRNALTALVRGEQCVLLVVVASDGSSPGRAGFKALVTSEGALFGSIGGGSMEHKLVELAKVRMTQISGGSPEVRRNPAATDPAHVRSSARDPAEVLMSEAEAFPSLKRQVHRADEPTDRSGMICSGEQTVVFFHLDQTVLPLLKHITGHLVNGRSVAVQLGPTGMRTDDIPGPSEHLAFQRNSDTDWTFSERLGVEQRMVILGAGHVGGTQSNDEPARLPRASDGRSRRPEHHGCEPMGAKAFCGGIRNHRAHHQRRPGIVCRARLLWLPDR
ncbi:MAG: XdhC family protein [Flavobacteriales bacterium]|nr:XdhC family protein [Flavobacteriales bacterium]